MVTVTVPTCVQCIQHLLGQAALLALVMPSTGFFTLPGSDDINPCGGILFLTSDFRCSLGV